MTSALRWGRRVGPNVMIVHISCVSSEVNLAEVINGRPLNRGEKLASKGDYLDSSAEQKRGREGKMESEMDSPSFRSSGGISLFAFVSSPCRPVARPGSLPGDRGPPRAHPVPGPRRAGHQIGKHQRCDAASALKAPR